MPRFQFERDSRTPSSESFIVLSDDKEIGRADIHFGPDMASATICMPEDFSDSDVQDLISDVDERLVMTAHPFRKDFVVTVWLGRHAGVFSEEMEEEAVEELDGNGLKE